MRKSLDGITLSRLFLLLAVYAFPRSPKQYYQHNVQRHYSTREAPEAPHDQHREIVARHDLLPSYPHTNQDVSHEEATMHW